MAMEPFILIRVHPFQRSLLILTGPVPSWYELAPTKTGFYREASEAVTHKF